MTMRFSAPLFLAAALAASFAVPGLADEKADPTGTWVWMRELEGQANRSVLKLVNKNGTLTGTYHRSGQTVPISKGKFEKGEVSFEAEGSFQEQKIRARFHGKLSQDEINGTIDIVIEDNSLPLPWTAKRGVDLDDVVGAWKIKLDAPNGNLESTLKLAADGENLKGVYTGRAGEHPAQDLKLEGNQLSWKVEAERNGGKFKGVYRAQITGNSLKGTLDFSLNDNNGKLEFTGERTPPEPGKSGPGKSEPGKPDNGTAPKANATPPVKSSRSTPDKPRPIVSLRGRDEILTVHYAGAHTVTFSIFGPKGQRIASNISLSTLQSQYPAIYQAYRLSYADAWSTTD
jgi:hypothetical protein